MIFHNMDRKHIYYLITLSLSSPLMAANYTQVQVNSDEEVTLTSSDHIDTQIIAGRTAVNISGNNAKLNMNGTEINTDASSTKAMYVDNGGVATINGGTINLGTNTTDSIGVQAGSNGKVLADSLTINSNGQNSYAVTATNGGEITISNSNIHTTNDKGFALTVNEQVIGTPSTGGKITANNVSITTEGNQAWAVSIDNVNGEVNLNNVDISTTGDGSRGIDARAGVVNADGLTINSTATAGNIVSSITVQNNGTVNAKNFDLSSSYYGVVLRDNGTLNLDTGTIKGKAPILFTENTSGIANTFMANNLTTPEAVNALFANNNANTNAIITNSNLIGTTNSILVQGSSTLNTTIQNSTLTGDVINNGGTLNLDMQNSGLTGKITNANNIKLDQSSMWAMKGSSSMDNLNTTGKTTFTHANPGSEYFTLTTGNLSGAGTFIMTTDVAGNQTDLIQATGSANSGNHKLNITNVGSANTTGQELVTVVETGGGSSQFGLTHSVEAGGYVYGLRQDPNQTNNWQLYSTGKKSSTAQAAGVDFLNSGYLLSYIDMQTLLQRMGELRSTEGQDGNVWVRGFAGKLNSFAGNNTDGFGMDYNGFQVGIDKLIPMDNGSAYVGVMGGYTHANPDYHAGTGTLRDYNFGLYGTYIDNSGFYIDTVAKYIQIKNEFNVTDTAGNKVNGTGRSRGYSLSVETGKRYNIQQTNFYLEPQLQAVYTRMGDATTHASNGLKIKLDSYDSILGRASLIGGYQIKHDANPVDVYLKTGYVREFSGNTAYYLNGNKEKHDFKGGWVDTAIGINAQFNKKHNIYGEVTYANGNRFDKQQINLGYRYQF